MVNIVSFPNIYFCLPQEMVSQMGDWTEDLDGAVTFSGDYDTPDFLIGVLTEGTTVHNIHLMSGYLHYENKLWRIGRNNSDWAELAQRLKDFVLEHSEDEITN